MTERTFLPTDPAVLDTARMTGHTPEYVAEAMNSPLAGRAGDSVRATADKAAIEAACDALLERHVTAFGGAVMDAMLTGYRLGFGHGVRSVAVADPIRRAFAGARPPSDVRPHVPHVDPDADDRLHLISDGHTACGIPVDENGPARIGTHDAAEADCPECIAALQRAVFTPVLQRVDAGSNEAPDLVARAAVDALDANGRAQARHDDTGDDLAVPKGWDRIEGGEEVTVDVIVGRSLDGELIDMTAAVAAYVEEHKLRWWQCRHCGRGRVMGDMRSARVRAEGGECHDHELHCEHAGTGVDA